MQGGGGGNSSLGASGPPTLCMHRNFSPGWVGGYMNRLGGPYYSKDLFGAARALLIIKGE